MNYKWLLFDADNTLFDYDKAEESALAASCRIFDLPCPPEIAEAYREINDNLWRLFELGKIDIPTLQLKRFELLFERFGKTVQAQAFSDTYLENLGNQTHLIKNALELVKTLYQTHKLALITNGIATVQRSRLDQSSLKPYFPVVTISDDVGVSKPDPAIFEAAFEQMNYPDKIDVLMIGDSLTSDMAGANNYGIDACWFNPHNHRPDPGIRLDYEIQSLKEIIEIVWY
ncbi:MAG: YjjG family noncanonical pyrimidine nucleotidase [Anaerolineales bacterium]|nr:YjjG family noncanonical pyrimidine nucleotidase [Anaerolineales bacterium]